MSKVKAKQVETKQVTMSPRYEWKTSTVKFEDSEFALSTIESLGFTIVSVTPICGSFGVQMVIVAKKEMKS